MNKSLESVVRVQSGGGESLRSERLFALWDIATQHDLGDEGRIRAILGETCKELGLELALVGEVVDDQCFVRFVHDPQARFTPDMQLPLASMPCQSVVEQGVSQFVSDLPGDPVLGSLPAVSQLHLMAYAGTPIWVGKKLWGVLAYASGQPIDNTREGDSLAYIELVANWISLLQNQAIQRAQLEQLVMTDELTGLMNRRAAKQHLQKEMELAHASGRSFTLGLIDLDYFKLVNDRYGHGVGDEVLNCFAHTVTKHLRAEDWIARWGGEEFLVCLHTEDITQAEAVILRLRDVLRAQPFGTSAGEIRITMSVGLSTYDLGEDNSDSLLACLDNNLYEAKQNGRDRIVSNRRRLGVLQMASMLNQASSEQRILIASQPIVDLGSRTVVADESLVRLRTPDGEVLSASHFINAAEGLGMMAEIDSTVARLTMGRCAGSLAQGRISPDFAHFVNLSPQFLARKDLVENLMCDAQSYCQACNIEMGPVKPIVFEITERQAIQNLDTLEHDLKFLLDFGFRLALDDFGSGYSSFLYLSRLPISFLKIEGWMIQHMHRNSKVMDLIKSMVGFAQNQGITTIAEHVEDEQTAQVLHQMGVDWAQGYLFGAPLLQD